MNYITTEDEMRSVIGTPHRSVYRKKIKYLEEHSKRFLKASCFIAITAKNIATGIHLVATQQSNLEIVDDITFIMTANIIIDNATFNKDEPCGLYVLIAGFEESLRINGKMSVIRAKTGSLVIKVKITELYFHCAKSIKRSIFWIPKDYSALTDKLLEKSKLSNTNVMAFIKNVPFLLLATQNRKGEVDLSPRGDPAGFVKVLDENRVLIPERPGNKIADSLTNIISNPKIALILFIPGSVESLILKGNARLTTSQTILEALEVKNKIPKIGIELTVTEVYFGINPVLENINLWDKTGFVVRSTFPSLGRIVSDQIQTARKTPGEGRIFGRVVRKMMTMLSDVAIKYDYRKNLY